MTKKKKLDSLENKLKSMDERVAKLENIQRDFQQSLSNNDTRLGSLEKEKDALKSYIKVLTDQVMNQGTKINLTGNRLARLEFEKLDKNPILWTVPCEMISAAKDIFASVVSSGLEFAAVQDFKIIERNQTVHGNEL